jgi:hypothetical protein
MGRSVLEDYLQMTTGNDKNWNAVTIPKGHFRQRVYDRRLQSIGNHNFSLPPINQATKSSGKSPIYSIALVHNVLLYQIGST